jgi:hypothetical protein
MANFSLLAKIGVDSKALQSGLKGAQTRVQAFKSSIGTLGPMIAAIGFTSLAKKAIDLGSKISDLSEQLRINAESLQVLLAVSAKAGVEQATLEKALMSVTIRTQEAMDGNKMYSESFERLGINLEEFAKLPTEKKIEAIAHAYKAAGKSQEAFSDIASILGTRAGPKMLEILRRISDEGLPALTNEAKKNGQVMDKDVIAKMDAAADQIGIFQNGLTILTGNVLSVAIPAFKIFGNGLGFVGDIVGVAASNFLSFGQAIGSIMKAIINPAIKQLEALGLAIKAASQFADADFEGAAKSLEGVKAAAKDSAAAFKAIPEEIGKAFDQLKSDGADAIKVMGESIEKRADSISNAWSDMTGQMVEDTEKAAADINGIDIDPNAAAGIAAAKEKAAIEAAAAAAEAASKEKLKELEDKISEMKLKALNAQANGDKEAEKAMNKRVKYAEKVVSFMKQFNMTQEEALNLATKLLGKEKDSESAAKSSLTGSDLLKASNIAGKGKGGRASDFASREAEAGLNLAGNNPMSGRDGNSSSLDKAEGDVRFERLGNGGYQQFVDGKKGEKFTEAQMQAGLQKQIDKDPTEALLEKINATLEGKFVSQ